MPPEIRITTKKPITKETSKTGFGGIETSINGSTITVNIPDDIGIKKIENNQDLLESLIKENWENLSPEEKKIATKLSDQTKLPSHQKPDTKTKLPDQQI